MKTVQAKDIPERDILEAIIAFAERAGPTPDEALSNRFPVKVIMAKLESLDDRGIVNWGVSLRTCWIEDQAYLRQHYPDLAERNAKVR